VFGALALAWLVAAVAAYAAPTSPGGRAYEQVSPTLKGGSVHVDAQQVRIATSGDAAQFGAMNAFDPAKGTGFLSDHISVRGPGGWTTHGITPKQDATSFFNFLFAPRYPLYEGEFSADLSKGVYYSIDLLTPDTPQLAYVSNLFLASDLLQGSGPSLDLLTAPSVPIGAEGPFTSYRPRFVAASADFSHILFESTKNLTADAPAQPDDCVNFGFGCLPRLYERVDGTVRLAGILPADEGGGAAPSSQAGQGTTFTRYVHNTISQDGSRVFFTSPAGSQSGAGQLYMRVNGTTTVRINASEHTTPDPTPSAAILHAVTPDGTKAVFESNELLTDDATGPPNNEKLYLYDAQAPAGSRLTFLTEDTEPADGDGGRVDGVLGLSDDGSYVYFAALGQLTAGAPDNSGTNLYVWHTDGGDAEVRFVGGLGGARDVVLNTGQGGWSGQDAKQARVTSDGTRLVFVSIGSAFLTGFNHGNFCFATGGANEACQEVYLYDATANGGDGRLRCASCSARAGTPRSHAWTQMRAAGFGPYSSHLNRPFSADGSKVFFSTAEGLVTEDRNKRYDAYEYDVDADRVQLISRGAGASDSYFMDASPSGDDVFFATRERLVGWDVDDLVDLYDARVGGGFPEPVAAAPPCDSADACRGDAASPAGAPTAGSVTFRSAGNADGRTGAALRVMALSRRQLRRWAATGETVLRVRVSKPGTLTALARARIGGRSRTVASATKTVKRRGVARVRLRLSKAARRKLRRGDALRLTLSIAYSQAGGLQHTTLTLGAGR
jgi:Tol biopolymer transport system component